MASHPSPKSSNDADVSSTNADGQAASPAKAFGTRLRSRAEELRISRSNLRTWTNTPNQTFGGYWNGDRIPPPELLLDLADQLDVSARWLLTGAEPPKGRHLAVASDADWIEVPEYDLRNITDESLGEALATAPIRRDWLYATTRATTDLWLARLLSDYAPAQLSEDDLVLCRTITVETLAEGNVCLWRVANNVVIGRYSVVPDASFIETPDGPRPDPRYATAYYDPALGITSPSLIVPPSAIEAGRYHLVGRILGAMIRPI